MLFLETEIILDSFLLYNVSTLWFQLESIINQYFTYHY